MNPNFLNPYRDSTETSRLVSDVDTKDFNFIYAIRPMKRGGTLQTTVNLLWSKLVYALKRNGITNVADIDKFEQFVTNCTIVPGDQANGRTDSGPVPNAAAQHDGRGTPRVGEAHQDVEKQHSDVKSTDRKQRIRRKR